MNSTNRRIVFGVMVATAVFFAGCQTTAPSGWRQDVRGSIDSSMTDAKAGDAKSSGVPADVSKGLLPPLEIAVPDGRKTPVEPRFDIAVSNAPARQVFMGLVEGTPYDIILQPDVGGNVTLNLKDATVPEALRALREVYGYEFRRDGNRFFVFGRDIQTRIFHVNYLNLQRRGKSDTRVKSGEIGSRTSGSGSATTPSGSNSSTPANIEVETQSQTDFWKDLGETIRTIVGASGERRVVVNPQAGIVVVRAMPDELRMVENYLGATQAAISRQVMLEAKVIEVQLNDRFQTGINWSKVHGDYTFSQVGGGTTNLATDGASSLSGGIGALRPGTGTFNPAFGSFSEAFGGVFSLVATTGDFTAFLELLKAQGEVQVLSSPRVSTVNNQKAVIKVGGEDFFVTGVTNSTTALTTGAQVTPSVELTSFFSGIALDVTPQIDDAGNIVLHIHPSVSTITEKSKSITVANDAFILPVASSNIQESDNVVRAQSGQIIVIGGLMKEASTEDNSSVPFLGDIPVLGNLFKHKRITRMKRELVILLKPTVIGEANGWSEEVRDSHERIKKIRIGS